MAATEQQYAPQTSGGGPPFRVINVPVSGAQDPTLPAPDMEVVVLADSGGNLLDDFRTTRRMNEVAMLNGIDARFAGMQRKHYERISFTDRRGNVERGTIR